MEGRGEGELNSMTGTGDIVAQSLEEEGLLRSSRYSVCSAMRTDSRATAWIQN